MAYVNTTRVASNRSLDRLSALLGTMKSAIDRRRVYARTLSELRTLNDRELADLGISRMSIVDVAREAAYGE